jgi:DNA ligase-1
MRVKQWNKLYKKAKKNKVSEWSIWVEVDDNNVPIVVRESGFIGHKHRTTKKYVRKGVNIGKSNEKTPLENAIAIAERFFNEHLEDNWIDDFNKLNDPPKYLKPMLAKPFKRVNRYKDMVVQPKYNGIRAVSFLHINDKRLISRERNEFESMKHISSVIPDMFVDKSPDGELYHHDMTFQEIVRRVKKYRPGLSEEIQYWVYDLAIPDIVFTERYEILTDIIGEHETIKVVPHFDVSSYEEFKHYHDKFVGDGYEGIIIRNKNSEYKFNSRPSCLQKYKEFKDAEFRIVGFDKEEWDDSGTIRDLVVWICETDKGEQFNVRPKGSFEDRIKKYNNADEYIGKFITVRYQEESENGTPIFGVGLSIRDYE